MLSPSRNVGFINLRRRDLGNFGSEKLSESKVEISPALVKHILYLLFFLPLPMFLFCLAFQTASNIELYNNPDKQERKQNETIITASSLRYTLPRKTRHGSRLQRSHFKHFENYDQSA